MRFVKVAAAATSLLVLGAATSLGSAGAATTGVGTAKAGTTVVGISLGTNGALLDVRLLGDDAQSTIDAKTAAAPEAFAKLNAASITSQTVPAVNTTVAPLETRQPGGKADDSRSSVDLSNPGGVVPASLGDVISGNLNLAKLTSSVDATSAKSTITGSLTNTKVAGALLDAQEVASTLDSVSAATSSTSTRSVDVGAITVLDLGALLDGLDIALKDLTPAEVSALLETLEQAIPGLDPGATLSDTIDAVQAKITEIQALVTGATGIVDGSAGTIINELGLDGVVPDATVTGITGTVVEQAQQLIDVLQAALADVLATALSTLDATALLKLDGVEVSVVAKAGDTLANSSASVTGKIGNVSIGSISVPGVDLLATGDAINAKLAEIKGTLDDVLSNVTNGTVDLSGLVDVKVLQKTGPTVETVNGYNTATAGLTAVTATITPPAELATLVAAIKAQTATSIATVIQGLGGTVPQLSDAMEDLETALGGIEALQSGGTVNVVQVLGSAEFRPSVAGTTGDPDPPLAATGANTVRLAGLGFLLIALGLGCGRWFRMPAPVWVRRRF